MLIPSHLLPLNNTKVKPVERKSVAFDKSDTNTDTTKQELITPVKVQEKRDGKDRRKRNVKVLLDTRSGRDRRYDQNRRSIDTKA